jgi:CBS domain containing-hemolysin-like protein
VETLAGFLLAHLGHIPEVGESLEQGGRRYSVAEMEGRRISRVTVQTLTPAKAVEAKSREATA